MKGISEHHVLMPNILPSLPNLDPDLDFTPSHDSLGSGNKIFDPGIFIEVQSERLLSRDEFSISFIRDPLSLVFDTLLYFHPKTRTKCSILVQRNEKKAKRMTGQYEVQVQKVQYEVQVQRAVRDFCCSKRGLEDKILVPKPTQNCATCGDPVDGLHCRSCTFVRKCLNE
ncbi:hypothetical protein Tco_0561011, partial [Tanacetum coccineum]